MNDCFENDWVEVVKVNSISRISLIALAFLQLTNKESILSWTVSLQYDESGIVCTYWELMRKLVRIDFQFNNYIPQKSMFRFYIKDKRFFFVAFKLITAQTLFQTQKRCTISGFKIHVSELILWSCCTISTLSLQCVQWPFHFFLLLYFTTSSDWL